MKEIVTKLNESEIQYFSTIGLDGKPKVRPFQFMFEEEGKLWFCSSTEKEVYKELQENPYIELCTSLQEMTWMRLSAKVVFSDRLDIKEKVLTFSPLVKRIYKEACNPIFSVFYLTSGSAAICKIGKPPVQYYFE